MKMSAEGVILSGVQKNTKLCTDTSLESSAETMRTPKVLRDHRFRISQAKGQGWQQGNTRLCMDAYIHRTASL